MGEITTMPDEAATPSPNVMTLAGLRPVGSIGPNKLIENTIATAEDVDFVCDTVLHNDRVWKATRTDDIGDCYDGREPEDENVVADLPKAAGGTETIVVGLALIGERQSNETCSQQTTRVATDLVRNGRAVGGHTAEVHGHGEGADMNCGCGACDKLRQGLEYMTVAENAHALQETARKLGVQVDDAMTARIVANAAELLATGYADGGRNIVNAIKSAGGESCAPKLGGEHLEAVVVINRVFGETLDRTALRQVMEESGRPNVQAFGLDMWAIREAARNFASSPDKVEEFVAAMVFHNLAIAAELCDGSLRVVVR